MRILWISPRRTQIKVLVESEEDLWTLKVVLRPGDLIEGWTTRDVASGLGGEKERRPIMVKLRVENVEFQPFTGKLRVFGVIVEGPEEYGVRGKHHSMLVAPGHTIMIERDGGWSERVIERIRSSGPRGRALIVAIDYDEYAIGLLSAHGFKVLVEGSSSLPGKDDPRREDALDRYVELVARSVVESTSDNVSIAIVVGPGYLKHSIASKVRELAPTLRVYVDEASTGGVAGLREALRRTSILEYLKEFSVVEAEAVLEEFMSLIAREPERVAYGIEDVRNVALMGAIKHVVILDSLISSIDDEVREAADTILSRAEDVKAKVTIVHSESPPGERIEKLGGVIAILRYPIPLEARRLSA